MLTLNTKTTEIVRTSQSWDGVEMVGTIHHGANRSTQHLFIFAE